MANGGMLRMDEEEGQLRVVQPATEQEMLVLRAEDMVSVTSQGHGVALVTMHDVYEVDLRPAGGSAEQAKAMCDRVMAARSISIEQQVAALAQTIERTLAVRSVVDDSVSLQVGGIAHEPVTPVSMQHGDIVSLSSAAPEKATATALSAILLVLSWIEADLHLRPYPQTLWTSAQVRRIVFVNDLAFAGQRRKAVPDMSGHTLFIDVEAGHRDFGYARRVLHHELFHFIEYFGWHHASGLVDAESWCALNPAHFQYRHASGAQAQDDAVVEQRTEYGFLNSYAMSAPEEDRAELYGFLMVDFALVRRHSQNDQFLARKVQAIARFLGRIIDDVDQFRSFWQALSAP